MYSHGTYQYKLKDYKLKSHTVRRDFFCIAQKKIVCFNNKWWTGFLSTINGFAGYGLIGRTRWF